MQRASDTLAEVNANPFPILGRPRLCKQASHDKAPHLEHLPDGWPAPVIRRPDSAPPKPESPQPQPQKPKANFHCPTLLRWVARLKRIFDCR